MASNYYQSDLTTLVADEHHLASPLLRSFEGSANSKASVANCNIYQQLRTQSSLQQSRLKKFQRSISTEIEMNKGNDHSISESNKKRSLSDTGAELTRYALLNTEKRPPGMNVLKAAKSCEGICYDEQLSCSPLNLSAKSSSAFSEDTGFTQKFHYIRANEEYNHLNSKPRLCVLGVCAMDKKTKSKPMKHILDRLRAYAEFEIIIMGNSLILNDAIDVTEWPVVDCLISFTSLGFPLKKALEYVKLRRPFCINDIPSQLSLLSRATVYRILESAGVPTPHHLYVQRTIDTLSPNPVEDFHRAVLVESDDYIEVDGQRMYKPIVEKPFDGDDHNIYIYYGKKHGGGSRRLFRKIGNRSSRFYPKVNGLRRDGNFIYEELLKNGKDLKVYTIGPGYCHGEVRKSPVVDGIVERDLDDKELRLLTKLTEKEKQIAAAICVSFKQNICGFDMIRWQNKSYVIDVNGWSFVKGNMRYYDKCARILRKMCLGCRQGRHSLALSTLLPAPFPPSQPYQPAHVMKSKDGISPVALSSSAPDSPLMGATAPLVNIAMGTAAGAFGAVNSLLNSPPKKIEYSFQNPSQFSLIEDNAPASRSPKFLRDRGLRFYHKNGTKLSNYLDQCNLIQDSDNNDVLRSVVAVFRHADRTPKQKIKLRSKYPGLVAFFPALPVSMSSSSETTTSGFRKKSVDLSINNFSEIKFKKPADCAQVLIVIVEMLNREKKRQNREKRRQPSANFVKGVDGLNGHSSMVSIHDSDSESDDKTSSWSFDSQQSEKEKAMERTLERERKERARRENTKDPEYYQKLLRIRMVLEKQFSGIKLQLKPTKARSGRVTQVLLVCKWGGQMTHAGIGQARQYAAAFWDDIISPPHNPLIYTIPFNPLPVGEPSEGMNPGPLVLTRPLSEYAAVSAPEDRVLMPVDDEDLVTLGLDVIALPKSEDTDNQKLSINRSDGVIAGSASQTLATFDKSEATNISSTHEQDSFKTKLYQFERRRLNFLQGMHVYSSDEARVIASSEAFYQSSMEYCSGILDPENDKSIYARQVLDNIRMQMPDAIHYGSDVNVYLDDASMCLSTMQRAKDAVRFLLTAEHYWTPGQVTSHMIMREHLELANNEAERLEAEAEERALLLQAKHIADLREQKEREWNDLRKRSKQKEERVQLLLDEWAIQEEDPSVDTRDPKNDSQSFANSVSASATNTENKLNHHIDEELYDRSPVQTARQLSNPLPDSPAATPPPSPNTATSQTSMSAWGMRCLRWIGKPRDTLFKMLELMQALQLQIHEKCEFVEKLHHKREHAGSDSEITFDNSYVDTSDASISKKTAHIHANESNTSDEEPGDVFEYVFEPGDEEIVGDRYRRRIKKGMHGFSIDHELCGGETLLLLKSRWDKIISDFYDAKTQEFDPTKIPDVYDCIKYDVLHNSEFLTGVRPLYMLAKRVADFVVPHEYGVLRKDRWHIGTSIAARLFKRISDDLAQGLQDNPPPQRRANLYFSSESHIHALRNILLFSGVADNETMAIVLDSMELNYLSHAVFRLYEDISKPLDDPCRFYVNIQFSPGAALDPFIFTEEGHILPVSRPVPVNGRVPFETFKRLADQAPVIVVPKANKSKQ